MLVASWHPIPCLAGVRMAFATHLHGRDAEVTVERGRARVALVRRLAGAATSSRRATPTTAPRRSWPPRTRSARSTRRRLT